MKARSPEPEPDRGPGTSRSPIAQLLLSGTLAVPEDGPLGKLVGRGLNLLRRTLARRWDPLVIYELEGRKILLPLSHNLPATRKQTPEYGRNLGRIAAAICAKYPDAAAIDIGANVGDSVAIIRAHCAMPILCIEADARFMRILERNLASLGHGVELFEGFVATERSRLCGALTSGEGTARLVPRSGDVCVEAGSLAEVLERFPRFSRAKLLKIDTDGYDLAILRGAAPLLEAASPVLFFEYDPHFLELAGENGVRALARLRESGYSSALIYDNLGDLLLATDLANTGLLGDLNAYYSGRRAQRYMDLCVFSRNDADLYQSLYRAERDYFSRTRAFGPGPAS